MTKRFLALILCVALVMGLSINVYADSGDAVEVKQTWDKTQFHCSSNGNGRVWPSLDIRDSDVLYGLFTHAGVTQNNKTMWQLLKYRVVDSTNNSKYLDPPVCPKCGSSYWVSFSNNSELPDGKNIQLNHGDEKTPDSETYSLTITKVVDAPEGFVNKVYSFTVTDGGEYSQTFAIDMSEQDSYTIEGLEAGTYTVTEANASESGYTWAVKYEAGEVETNSVVLGGENGDGSITITNTYTEETVDPETYSLTITKVVDAPEGFVNKVYSFTVTDGGEYSQTFAIDMSEQDSYTIEGLEAGTYTVTEADASESGYTWAVKYEVGEVETNSVVLGGENGDGSITITNTYTEETVDTETYSLTITKVVDAPEGFASKVYSFTVTDGGEYSQTFAIDMSEQDSYTIEGLEAGTYTVTEANASESGYTWAVKYEVGEVETNSVVLGGENGDGSITVTNTYTRRTVVTQSYGTLRITKTVDAPSDAQGFADKVFTFTIWQGGSQILTDADGNSIATQLRDGESASINLLAGTYTVREEGAAVSGFELSTTGLDTVSVVEDGVTTVSVTNTYTVIDDDDDDEEDFEDENGNEEDEDIILDDVLSGYQPEDILIPEEIYLEDVLADLPNTGADSMASYAFGAMAAFGGLLGVLKGKKKDEE